LVQAHRELLSSQVALYAALGGGTQTAATQAAPETPAPASSSILEVAPPP